MSLENSDNSIEQNQSTEHSNSEPTTNPKEAKAATPPPMAKTTPQPCSQHPELTCNTKRDWIDKTALCLEGFGLFVLIVYTIATIAIWYANKKAAEAAESAANTASDTLREVRNEQRPWVVIKDASVNLTPMTTAKVEAVFTNAGHSPALETQIIARLHFTNDPNADLPPLGSPEDDVTSAIMAPTMESHIHLHGVDILSAPLVEGLKKPDVHFYVYGHGTYKDTTTERVTHHLEFCVYAQYGIVGLTPCTNKRYKNTTD